MRSLALEARVPRSPAGYLMLRIKALRARTAGGLTVPIEALVLPRLRSLSVEIPKRADRFKTCPLFLVLPLGIEPGTAP